MALVVRDVEVDTALGREGGEVAVRGILLVRFETLLEYEPDSEELAERLDSIGNRA